MRCIVLSDAIWMHPPSGYSKIAGQLCVLFNKDGHVTAHVPIDVGIRGTSMLRHHTMTWHKTLLLEGGSGPDLMSENAALNHYYDFKADFLLTFKDLWVFRYLRDLPLNWISMTAVDHSPVSREVTIRLQTAFQIISITRFGKRELLKAGIPSTYIPLFVDTDLYKPIEEMMDEAKIKLGAKTRADAKQIFGMPPDSFTILILAMNRRRKMIPRTLRACKRFLDSNPDYAKNTQILLWTLPVPELYSEDAASGTILGSVIRKLELDNHVIIPDAKLYQTGLEEWRMPLLYNAADCILCSSAEGFWMPGIEAGATGCPAVVVEYAAAPEVTTGELARVADWDVMNPIGYDQPLVDVDSMAEGIAKICNGDPERYRKEAREYSLKYDIVTVYEKYWHPFLAKIEPQLRPLVTKEGIGSWKLA